MKLFFLILIVAGAIASGIGWLSSLNTPEVIGYGFDAQCSVTPVGSLTGLVPIGLLVCIFGAIGTAYIDYIGVSE